MKLQSVLNVLKNAQAWLWDGKIYLEDYEGGDKCWYICNAAERAAELLSEKEQWSEAELFDVVHEAKERITRSFRNRERGTNSAMSIHDMLRYVSGAEAHTRRGKQRARMLHLQSVIQELENEIESQNKLEW